VNVVSDSSPLITLARIQCFHFLPKLYRKIYISTEVHREVVIDGAGMPGADQVARADWIEVKAVRDTAGLAAATAKTGLGAGEVSAVFLARELPADLLLIDDWTARRYAQADGLPIVGCIGILEELYEQGELGDLRTAYRQLIQHKARVNLQVLQHSLRKFKLSPL
jgi:predicted nucleic acid-binding protein